MKDVEVQIEVRETVIYRCIRTMCEDTYNNWCIILQTAPKGSSLRVRDILIDEGQDKCDFYDLEVTLFERVK